MREAVEAAMADAIAWFFGEHDTPADAAKAALDAALAAGCLLPEQMEQVDDWLVYPNQNMRDTAKWHVHRRDTACDKEPRCVPVFILKGANE